LGLMPTTRPVPSAASAQSEVTVDCTGQVA